jgi:hypothetical protein
VPYRYFNTCHESLDRCLLEANLPIPPHPKFGCRDCRRRFEYPNEYEWPPVLLGGF